MCLILAKQQVCWKYIIFSLLTKRRRRPDGIALRAGFGLRDVVWRPWFIAASVFVLLLLSIKTNSLENTFSI